MDSVFSFFFFYFHIYIVCTHIWLNFLMDDSFSYITKLEEKRRRAPWLQVVSWFHSEIINQSCGPLVQLSVQCQLVHSSSDIVVNRKYTCTSSVYGRMALNFLVVVGFYFQWCCKSLEKIDVLLQSMEEWLWTFWWWVSILSDVVEV
jgi:hypothetical protein